MTAKEAKALSHQHRIATDLPRANEAILKAAKEGKNKCYVYYSLQQATIEELIGLGYKVRDISDHTDTVIEINFE